NYQPVIDPLVYEHSDIDTSPKRVGGIFGAEADYFVLFDFSAKYDPIPTMLVQNHVDVVNGFLGQCTGYFTNVVKKHITILGDSEDKGEVKYLHGKFGAGTFTFLGGHDPEDYQHRIGDPPTDLELHKNSPGYRLILNNVLFPAAKKKERKT
ncbi:MAG: asparagine synthetase B, partial [candidate division Zixibacteria bacterium]|nr:asparagine synthetase B [candidate division Zixibacteria bacterium]